MLKIDSIETYGYRTRKDIIHKNEEIKFNSIIKQYKIKLATNSSSSVQNIGGTGSRKSNELHNLISHQPDTDKMYLYTKDQYE